MLEDASLQKDKWFLKSGSEDRYAEGLPGPVDSTLLWGALFSPSVHHLAGGPILIAWELDSFIKLRLPELRVCISLFHGLISILKQSSWEQKTFCNPMARILKGKRKFSENICKNKLSPWSVKDVCDATCDLEQTLK